MLELVRMGGRRSEAVGHEHDETADDLPCPWCLTATSEGDQRCPGCQRRFG